MTNVLLDEAADNADIGVSALDVEGVADAGAVGTGGGLVEWEPAWEWEWDWDWDWDWD